MKKHSWTAVEPADRDDVCGRYPPTPDEIVEAKMDGACPRCGKRGTFGDDGGWCDCGFSY